jgi:hypothetical protein
VLEKYFLLFRHRFCLTSVNCRGSGCKIILALRQADCEEVGKKRPRMLSLRPGAGVAEWQTLRT